MSKSIDVWCYRLFGLMCLVLGAIAHHNGSDDDTALMIIGFMHLIGATVIRAIEKMSG